MSYKKTETNILKQFAFNPKNDKASVFHFYKSPLRDVIIGTKNSNNETSIESRLSAKFHILEYVLSGEGELEIGDKKYPIKANNTLFLQKGTKHSIFSDSLKPIEKIWIAFSCNYLNSMIVDFSISNGVYFIDSFPEFKTLSLLSKNESDNSMIYTIAQNLHSILSGIASSHINVKDDKLLLSIKVKLDSLLYGKGTLDNITEELGISKATIIRLFKKEYGVTPYKYLLDKKLNMAKEYLKTSQLSIKNIALMLSFTDEHYFTYIFTKKNGFSPSDYRKQYSII